MSDLEAELLRRTCEVADCSAQCVYPEEIIAILRKNVDPNVRDESQQTPLVWAARRGFTDVARALLEAGADTEAKDRDGATPLIRAARFNHIEVVRLLLEKRADKDAVDAGGYTPLIWAASKGHLEVVKELLAADANPDFADQKGCTAVAWATWFGHVEAALALLEAGADTEIAADTQPANNVHQTEVAAASEEALKDDATLGADYAGEMVQSAGETAACMKANADQRKAEETGPVDVMSSWEAPYSQEEQRPVGCAPLILAAAWGRTEMVDLLLAHNANTEAADAEGRTPLLWAAMRGRVGIARALLVKGADANAADTVGCTPLFLAAALGHLKMVHLLLAHNANMEATDQEGRTPLLWAAMLGRVDIARALLVKGADANAADKVGCTPLILAAARGHMEMVDLLLAYNANREATDTEGRTPLLWAAMRGRVDIARALLVKGADANAADTVGCTQLLLAAAWGHLEMVDLLLAHNAYTEATDQEGRTPLLWAAMLGRVDIARALLVKGADANAADKDGCTPLMRAAVHRIRRSPLVDALLRAGAEVNAVDNAGYTPLKWAAMYYNYDAAGTLRSAGGRMEAPDKEAASWPHACAGDPPQAPTSPGAGPPAPAAQPTGSDPAVTYAQKLASARRPPMASIGTADRAAALGAGKLAGFASSPPSLTVSATGISETPAAANASQTPPAPGVRTYASLLLTASSGSNSSSNGGNGSKSAAVGAAASKPAPAAATIGRINNPAQTTARGPAPQPGKETAPAPGPSRQLLPWPGPTGSRPSTRPPAAAAATAWAGGSLPQAAQVSPAPSSGTQQRQAQAPVQQPRTHTQQSEPQPAWVSGRGGPLGTAEGRAQQPAWGRPPQPPSKAAQPGPRPPSAPQQAKPAPELGGVPPTPGAGVANPATAEVMGPGTPVIHAQKRLAAKPLPLAGALGLPATCASSSEAGPRRSAGMAAEPWNASAVAWGPLAPSVQQAPCSSAAGAGPAAVEGVPPAAALPIPTPVPVPSTVAVAVSRASPMLRTPYLPDLLNACQISTAAVAVPPRPPPPAASQRVSIAVQPGPYLPWGTEASAATSGIGAPLPPAALPRAVSPQRPEHAPVSREGARESSDSGSGSKARGSYVCPLCEHATSCWALVTCCHRGPCERCCPTEEDVLKVYPACARCKTATQQGKVMKMKIS